MAMGVRCATTWSVDGAGGGGTPKRRRTHAEDEPAVSRLRGPHPYGVQPEGNLLAGGATPCEYVRGKNKVDFACLFRVVAASRFTFFRRPAQHHPYSTRVECREGNQHCVQVASSFLKCMHPVYPTAHLLQHAVS